ncbi:glycosyltransferase family 4 protein [Robertkochia solimangrovi]|uniref:glycosyltransferase family 4 protein n=1 Tax=Robertkochia solimangrovi TaxID=2213046 RepID=UPI0013A52BD6|nr:glycosyltransferase family 4 protein [Robertkochia solimangrovi]
MKVLWITNTIFPDFAEALHIHKPVVGGWMYGLADALASCKNLKLHVATIDTQLPPCSKSIRNIDFHLLKTSSRFHYDQQLESQWKKLVDDIQPDLIHIHGTEYPHGLACMQANNNQKYVISIQGLISVYSRYYLGGLSSGEILRSMTLRDVLKQDGIFRSAAKFKDRGKHEIEYIRKTRHVIGRTTWDKSHSYAINPEVNYHFCNEALRNKFYEAPSWKLESAEPHTIFVSQSASPLKGLQQVIKALPIIKHAFPNVKIKIAGPDKFRQPGFKEQLKKDGYGNYLQKLARDLSVMDSIEFLGMLSEEEMISQFQRSHVFVCPSSIENSPNSLGEAQLIGTPVIASYTGGIPDMVEHEQSGLLYRFEEYEMLAYFIKMVFSNDELAHKLSDCGISAAHKRHDRTVIRESTIQIYKEIVTSN